MQSQQAIGKQAKIWGESVENTVATADGAPTTGQGKNVTGHAVYSAEVANYVSQLNLFDISNTTGKEYLNNKPPGAPLLTLPVALMRYEPKFEAVTLSINMNLPLDNVNVYRNWPLGLQRLVRLQMFVDGPYQGLHRYVASVHPVARQDNSTTEVGRAVNYDMAIGMVDPISIYWRPPLLSASYPNGYYSFLRESVLIREQLVNWNANLQGAAANSYTVNVDQVMRMRLAWQQYALATGFVYPLPAGAVVPELNVPWQLPIIGRSLNGGVVREYPSI